MKPFSKPDINIANPIDPFLNSAHVSAVSLQMSTSKFGNNIFLKNLNIAPQMVLQLALQKPLLTKGEQIHNERRCFCARLCRVEFYRKMGSWYNFTSVKGLPYKFSNVKVLWLNLHHRCFVIYVLFMAFSENR